MRKISIMVGPPVEGDDFYGRESDLRYAWESHISKGVSLLLSAPRRVGKSSFSKKMLKLAEEHGWKTLYLDLEGLRTESDFIKLLNEGLQKENWWKNIKSKFENTVSNIFDSIKDIEIAGNRVSIDGDVWRSNAYGKIKQLFESFGETLIVIDELAIYLDNLLLQENGMEKVEFFLEWLRKFRQTTKIRLILCSSVSIENFASMHQLSKHLNDLYPLFIGAFSEFEARDFISLLDIHESFQFTEDHIQYILDKLVWHLPFFIQLLVEKIYFLLRIKGKQLSNETIDEAYNLLLAENHFNTWDERLKQYNEYERNARIVLKLCATPTGRNKAELLANLSTNKNEMEEAESILAKLLNMLINDGYLIENCDKYIFSSPLLRDFWYNRYVK